jgi:trk/ktr system potassium uptake protein
MRVAIAGAGNVGQHAANSLLEAGHEVLLIEQNQNVVDRATVDKRIEWYVGDACEVASLREAGLDTCEVLVAATGDDEDNLVVSLLAKQEFAIPRVIARVNHPKNEWMFTENWGVDLFVSTPTLITAMVEEAVSVGRLVEILRFEGGLARLVEVTLADDAGVVGRSIAEISLPRDATIVAILRDEHLEVPRGDTVFAPGDEVLALVTPDSEDEIRLILTGASAA